MKNINSSERLNGKISVENWYAYRDEAGKFAREEISPIFFFFFSYVSSNRLSARVSRLVQVGSFKL